MERKIAIVGLGYVGLPLAVAFGKTQKLIGFDVGKKRIEELTQGMDRTNEVTAGDLSVADIDFTFDPSRLKEADFIIVAVPTPISQARRPDLTALENASKTIGENLSPGSIVVYESTVYPGVTDDVCAPILSQTSGLTRGKDFFLGYSPERINPGDKVHTLEKIVKVVSGDTPEVLDIVAEVYESVVDAGVHRATDIKTAEAAKVIENIQRDLNIALVNELSMIFDRLGIDTLNVLEAAGTKWNFLPFRPGLVGGHCIGVDPYYLTHKAEELGYHPQVILAGRRVNDGMADFITQQTVKLLIASGRNPKDARVGLLGLTFKEDVPDMRNSKVCEIATKLKEFHINVLAHDPMAEPKEAEDVLGAPMADIGALQNLDGVIICVPHAYYLERGAAWIREIVRPNGVVVDVKSIFTESEFDDDCVYWRL